jgi:hypothetical protein
MLVTDETNGSGNPSDKFVSGSEPYIGDDFPQTG